MWTPPPGDTVLHLLSLVALAAQAMTAALAAGRELYVSVSVITGLFYATGFALMLNSELWTALTFLLGLTFRLLAIRYKWEMPKLVFTGAQR